MLFSSEIIQGKRGEGALFEFYILFQTPVDVWCLGFVCQDKEGGGGAQRKSPERRLLLNSFCPLSSLFPYLDTRSCFLASFILI